jgi:hypothetical protein
MHVSRSVTSDQAAYREFMTGFDTATVAKEGEETSAEKKQEIIRDLVKKVTEGQGCLQGNKETGGSTKDVKGIEADDRCRACSCFATTYVGGEL